MHIRGRYPLDQHLAGRARLLTAPESLSLCHLLLVTRPRSPTRSPDGLLASSDSPRLVPSVTPGAYCGAVVVNRRRALSSGVSCGSTSDVTRSRPRRAVQGPRLQARGARAPHAEAGVGIGFLDPHKKTSRIPVQISRRGRRTEGNGLLQRPVNFETPNAPGSIVPLKTSATPGGVDGGRAPPRPAVPPASSAHPRVRPDP